MIRCWLILPLRDFVTVTCFVVRYSVSILVLQSSWCGRESFAMFVLVSCNCCVAFSHGATGSSAVCDYGI